MVRMHSSRVRPRWVSWTVVFVPPLLWAASLWFSQAREATFFQLTVEDGWVENGQVALFLLAALLSVSISRKLFRQGRWGWAVVYGLLALALFWVAGEEISWGQRLFGFQTTEWFKARNVQREMNLHNIHAVGRTLGRLTRETLIGVTVMSSVLWRLDEARQRRWAIRLWVPHPMLIPSWLCVLSYPLLRRWYHVRNPDEQQVSLVVSRLQEPNELILAAAIVTWVWLVHREIVTSRDAR